METPTPKPTRPRRRDADDGRAERKRIQDRLAQRATRERTKNRIAYLEQRLSSLEAGDKDGEITNLTRIIDNLRNDNNRLRNALVKMRTTIDQAVLAVDDHSEAQSQVKPCGCSLEANCTGHHSPFVPAAAPPFEEQTTAFRQNSVSSTSASDVPELVNGPGADVNLGTEPFDVGNSTTGPGLGEFFDFSHPNALLEMFEYGMAGYNDWQSPAASPLDFRFPSSEAMVKVAPDLEKWEVSNGAFISCLESVKKRASSTCTLDVHVPFKAAIWGWDNIGPEAYHPIWNALRQVDQRVFGTWKSKAQRIALMYVCYTLIAYREHPTKENLERVPAFLRPRPSQEKIQHPAVIDFLVWPGLRDRLVFEYKKYTSTGDFSAAFVENFNFHWPYSDKEIFAYNHVHNRYEVSRMFLNQAHNFKNWTMKPTFFEQFPEMQNDIPVFDGTTDSPKPSWAF